MNDLLPGSKQIINGLISQRKNPGKSISLKLGGAINPVDCSNVDNISTLTPLDMINSMIYARHRILKDKCNALAASGAGVAWQPIIPDGTVPYTCPPSLNLSSSITGATGPSTCTYGHCAIVTQNECLKYSKLPYDEKTGDPTPDAGNSFYMEWRPKPGMTSAATSVATSVTASGATGTGGMGCYLGNFAFRRWCTIPQTRDPDNPDNDPLDAFVYTANGPTGGTCSLTADYCHHKNLHWDADSQSCYRTDGQKFVEALFGQTLDAFFTGNCNPFSSSSSSSASSSSPTSKSSSRNLSAPKTFRKLSDRRLKDKLVKLADDYGGKGVHLYMYFYSTKALQMHPGYKSMQLGFVADEVEKLYPEIITEYDGYKYISFTIDQLKEQRYWRIINTLKNEHIILNTLLERYMLKPVGKDG
jgi:hypothetical protein